MSRPAALAPRDMPIAPPANYGALIAETEQAVAALRQRITQAKSEEKAQLAPAQRAVEQALQALEQRVQHHQQIRAPLQAELQRLELQLQDWHTLARPASGNGSESSVAGGLALDCRVLRTVLEVDCAARADVTPPVQASAAALPMSPVTAEMNQVVKALLASPSEPQLPSNQSRVPIWTESAEGVGVRDRSLTRSQLGS